MKNKTEDDLISFIETSRAKRKTKLLWSFLTIGILSTILIWTTEIPEWWNQMSPYAYLNFLLMIYAFLWVQSSAVKNEELLLRRLKELES